jgi:histidyl-tRNA synthetase
MTDADTRPTALRAPKGVAEYIGEAGTQFLVVRDSLVTQARLAGYQYLELPVFEDTSLYIRGVGESTDVVGKEMFTFNDRAGRSLTLRPEGTAGAIRAVIEHGLDNGSLPVKVAYAGPFFRAERPQHGRYRQFSQVGVEAVGSDDPVLDAEVIAIADAGYRSLGLTRFELLVNSLGCQDCRGRYRDVLLAYWRQAELDEVTWQRAQLNPLRILDDKRPELAAVIIAAPTPAENLCADCVEHLTEVQYLLDAAGIAWTAAPRLVRGLDYYTRTTFEFSHELLGAQSGIGGGGRYDGLVAMLGGSHIGGVGFGLGVDRTLLACQAEGLAVGADTACEVFGIALTPPARSEVFAILAQLRHAGVSTDMAVDNRSMRASMKTANRLAARYAIIVGDRELEQRSATVRDLQSGAQHVVTLDDLPHQLVGLLASASPPGMEGHS